MKKGKMAIVFVCGLLIGCLLAGPGASAAVDFVTGQLSTQPVYVNGNLVQIKAYNINGNNYVQLRDAGRAIGFNVYWDGTAVQVQTGVPYTGEAPGGTHIGGTGMEPNFPNISQEDAIDIALGHAGVTRSQVTGLRSEQGHENGRLVWEVEFFIGTTEYDYDIDAANGAVTDVDIDYHGGAQNGDVGQENAINTALKHAGFSRSQVTGLKAEKNYDDGRLIYEVEFYVGTTEYDYDIDAATGAVVDVDIDYHGVY